jgi:hypothetical protein
MVVTMGVLRHMSAVLLGSDTALLSKDVTDVEIG